MPSPAPCSATRRLLDRDAIAGLPGTRAVGGAPVVAAVAHLVAVPVRHVPVPLHERAVHHEDGVGGEGAEIGGPDDPEERDHAPNPGAEGFGAPVDDRAALVVPEEPHAGEAR